VPDRSVEMDQVDSGVFHGFSIRFSCN
jgi:hypothetical protein